MTPSLRATALSAVAFMAATLLFLPAQEPPPAVTASAASIVSVEHWRKQQRVAAGCGFFVPAPDPQHPWVLSSLLERQEGDQFQIELGRTMVEGILLAHDPKLGLALFQLKNPTERPPLPIAATSPSADQAGLSVLLMPTQSTPGTPAILGRFACREPLAPLDPTLLRLHLPAPLTLLGTPVFDEQLHIIALLSRPVPNVPDSFYAVPAERLQKFLNDIRLHGKPVQPLLGIAVTKSITAPIITGCRPDSPALLAGLEPNDLVLSVGKTPIANLQDLIDATELLPANQPIEIKILRGQQIKTLKLTPRLKPDISI